MKKNIGTIDRVIRILVAIAVAVLYFTGVISGTSGIVLLILGGIFLITAIISFCPLYYPFNLRTIKKE